MKITFYTLSYATNSIDTEKTGDIIESTDGVKSEVGDADATAGVNPYYDLSILDTLFDDLSNKTDQIITGGNSKCSYLIHTLLPISRNWSLEV